MTRRPAGSGRTVGERGIDKWFTAPRWCDGGDVHYMHRADRYAADLSARRPQFLFMSPPGPAGPPGRAPHVVASGRAAPRRIPARSAITSIRCQMLLDACSNKRGLQNLRDAAVLALCCKAGLRRAEVVAVAVGDIEMNEDGGVAVRVVGKAGGDAGEAPPGSGPADDVGCRRRRPARRTRVDAAAVGTEAGVRENTVVDIASYRRRTRPVAGRPAGRPGPGGKPITTADALALVPEPEPETAALETARAEDRERVGTARADSRSAATRRACRAQWQAFADWCERRQVNALPADPRDVAAFLADRATGRRAATVAQGAAAIRAAHRAADLSNPTSAPVVRETLQGIRRQHARLPELAPRQAKPLDYDGAVRLLALSNQPQAAGRNGLERPSGPRRGAASTGASWRCSSAPGCGARKCRRSGGPTWKRRRGPVSSASGCGRARPTRTVPGPTGGCW